jgi:hypothetical protein
MFAFRTEEDALERMKSAEVIFRQHFRCKSLNEDIRKAGLLESGGKTRVGEGGES